MCCLQRWHTTAHVQRYRMTSVTSQKNNVRLETAGATGDAKPTLQTVTAFCSYSRHKTWGIGKREGEVVELGRWMSK
jgi:hypothetical protein